MNAPSEIAGYAATLCFFLFSSSTSAEVITCSNILEIDDWSDSRVREIEWVEEVLIWKEEERLSKILYVRGLGGFATTHAIDCIKNVSIDRDQCFRDSGMSSYPQRLNYEVVRFINRDPDYVMWLTNKVIRRPVYEIEHSDFTLNLDTRSGLPTFFRGDVQTLPGYFDCEVFPTR